MTDFATRLRQTMFIKGIRQTEIAEKTGITKGRISRWVRGENTPNGENLAKLAVALGVSSDYLLGKEEAPRLTLPSFHEVPVLGKVAAGVPISAQEDIIGTITTDKECFALKIKGDSMSPRIMDGDIVLVRRQDYAEDGDLVIALIDDEATCKVLKKNHDSVTLVPFNPVFTPLVYSKDENLHILGRVIESRHEW